MGEEEDIEKRRFSDQAAVDGGHQQLQLYRPVRRSKHLQAGDAIWSRGGHVTNYLATRWSRFLPRRSIKRVCSKEFMISTTKVSATRCRSMVAISSFSSIAQSDAANTCRHSRLQGNFVPNKLPYTGVPRSLETAPYRGTSLIRTSPTLAPYSRGTSLMRNRPTLAPYGRFMS